MKPPFLTLAVLGLAALTASGCRTGHTARLPSSSNPGSDRLVRVSFCGQRGAFRFRINRGPVERLSTTEFTNAITALRLTYGDIVVWEAKRTETGIDTREPEGISAWWSGQLERNAASFYCIASSDVPDFFKIPMYHWKGPRGPPRPLAGC